MLEETLSTLYALCGIAGFIGYVPQIWRLWHDTTHAASTSLMTWGWWSFMSTVAILYASIVVKDVPFILVSASNVAGCWAVYGMALWRRYQTNTLL
jgi:hypothetical protein